MSKVELPLNIAKLCGRVASEQMKAEVWKLGHDLKLEFARRLEQGESEKDAEEELFQRLKAAVVDQAKRACR